MLLPEDLIQLGAELGQWGRWREYIGFPVLKLLKHSSHIVLTCPCEGSNIATGEQWNQVRGLRRMATDHFNFFRRLEDAWNFVTGQ